MIPVKPEETLHARGFESRFVVAVIKMYHRGISDVSIELENEQNNEACNARQTCIKCAGKSRHDT
jgi:hypothetical protein